MKHIDKVPAKLKHKTEDFIVEEIGEKWSCKISEEPNLDLPENEGNKGFLWCEMEKKNIDHFTAIKEIATRLNKSTQDIGYAGTKDKKAITSQRISIFKPDIKRIKSFNHPNIILKNFKWAKRKIKIGYLEANHFKIILRDIDKKDAMKITNHIRTTNWFPNYFGSQRFGINGNNIKIGKLILKKKFQEAIQKISKDQKYQQLKTKNQQLKSFPKKILLMYINAVQSKIFNDILRQALKENISFISGDKRQATSDKRPSTCLLIGYKSRFYDGRLGEIEQQVLKDHNLTIEDFDIREISYLRMKGSFRKAITEIKDLKIKTSDDEEFSGSKKITLQFTLPSGVYATTFLENFFTFLQTISSS